MRHSVVVVIAVVVVVVVRIVLHRDRNNIREVK